MQKAKTIGMVYAICDHFEGSTGLPVTLSTLKEATGHDRKEFRKWVRQGRLVEHRSRTLDGQERIGYTRPKVEGREAHAEEVNGGSKAQTEKIDTSAV